MYAHFVILKTKTNREIGIANDHTRQAGLLTKQQTRRLFYNENFSESTQSRAR